MLTKIDASGQYRYFPGLTVIAPIRHDDYHWWESIHNHLDHLLFLRDFYTPLPFASYHMTTNNGYSQFKDGGDNFEAFITPKLAQFRKMHAYLQAQSFEPEPQFSRIHIAEAIQIYLQLPKEQLQTIKQFAQDFNLTPNLPKLLHITLAYQYKTPIQEHLEYWQNQLNTYLQSMLSSHSIVLDAPRLCYFNDMTAFMPWDGSYYPFK